ncbi:MAG: polyprenyl synthetase family protein [Gammaproteobacteria bacterium]
MKTIDEVLNQYANRVNQHLSSWLPKESDSPTTLHQAMRYSVLGGGKRIRPVLLYATGTAMDTDLAKLDAAACAVELMHSYSLIHDDLPAMDNDELRRGLPTCHKAFDEATAILAGDAIQALAFAILANDTAPSQQRIKLIQLLAEASGSTGMAGGQAIDLASVNKALNQDEIEHMHRLKTGALIKASVMMAVTSSKVTDPEILNHFTYFADCIGLAFQIRDDILDIQTDTKILGKPQGSDAAQNKPTYPSVIGMKQAEKLANDLLQQALNELNSLEIQGNSLQAVSTYMVTRSS